MAIHFDQNTKTFFLDGKELTYAFRVAQTGYLSHLYFGAPIGHDDLSFTHRKGRNTFTVAPSGGFPDKESYEFYQSELAFFGTGDYREPAIHVQFPEGDRLIDLVYDSHKILSKKPLINGIPSLDGGETLVVRLKDKYSDFTADLYYTVWDDASVIARRAVYNNGTDSPLKIMRAYSFTFGLPGHDYNVLTLQGGWAAERSPQITPVHYGVVSIDSKRCSSSAFLNPFMALLPTETTEHAGDAYGINLVYSSSFVLKAEGTLAGDTLITGGINDFDFGWSLAPGESFETPEAVIAYSAEGLGGMSRAFHDAYRNHLINQKFVRTHRPLVINNWEATTFYFDIPKLKAFTDAIIGTGIDTFVLDDGWFGKRDSDTSGLGDWYVNEQKLGGTLRELIDYVHEKGLYFGLWFEPEMISRDSDLFREHPDYAIGMARKDLRECRHQYMLDLTRSEVRDHVVKTICDILDSNPIDYVKWDYNRNVSDIYSLGLAPQAQCEFAHRYVLGVYDICERIVKTHPDIFFEGCSGGGGRFDPAMLYYFPQIWTSDDTDAEERTRIQYGTSIAYPFSTMSCHVSESPNQQTGRITSFKTRADIAHLGATGYELDPTVLSDEERAQINGQVEEYKLYENLILAGDLYRLDSPFKSNFFTELVVAKDKNEAMLCVYRSKSSPNPTVKRVTLRGLDPEKTYHIDKLDITAKGSTLMRVGIAIPYKKQDFYSETYYVEAIK